MQNHIEELETEKKIILNKIKTKYFSSALRAIDRVVGLFYLFFQDERENLIQTHRVELLLEYSQLIEAFSHGSP